MSHHWLTRSHLLAGTAASLLAVATVPAGFGGAAAAASTARTVSATSSSSWASTGGTGSTLQSPEVRPGPGGSSADGAGAGGAPHRAFSLGHPGPPVAVTSSRTTGTVTKLAGFSGINMLKQRRADNGNQFSVEPPDQGLCVGNGFVVETVNDAIAVYDQAGVELKSASLNKFYGYASAFNRTPGAVDPFGPFVTDPTCLYDAATQRFFNVVLTIDVKAANGDFTGPNHLDLAVSPPGDPLGKWSIYKIAVQDDGSAGTPNHGCSNGAGGTGPCFGDYPHIGADANGIYLSTNEYDFFGNGYHGAQVYALSKAALAASGTSPVVQFDTHGADNGNSGFTVWPAQASGTDGAAGTEYLMSTNAAEEAAGTGTSKDLLVWALTGTDTIDRSTPALALNHTTVAVAPYAVPAGAGQKTGDYPLGQCVGNPSCSATIFGIKPVHQQEYRLDASDSRMQQVTFAAGKLWAAWSTGTSVSRAAATAGVEYAAVVPQVTGSAVSASVALNGYLADTRRNFTYPSVGMLPNGKGVVAFTVTGVNDYPSAGYAALDSRGIGEPQVAAAGAGPADGFSGYTPFNSPIRPRWGDYGATAVDGATIWLATEYVDASCPLKQYAADPNCGGTRATLANWGTRITQVKP